MSGAGPAGCPACGSAFWSRVSVGGETWRRCAECGHEWTERESSGE